jgi:hypothetical protein
VEFPSRDIEAVAANAEQVTEQKNLNKWPHKIRRILRNEENHGGYVYVTLEEMVNNFIANYTGDGTILGKLDAQKNTNSNKGLRNLP